MNLNDVSIVYIRRHPDEDLRMITTLANQYYDLHSTDFLVLDVSPDDAALSALARAGDPFRYLAVTAADPAHLIEYAFGVATHNRLIIIDDLVQHVAPSAYAGRDVRLVSKSSSSCVLSAPPLNTHS